MNNVMRPGANGLPESAAERAQKHPRGRVHPIALEKAPTRL